MAGFSRKLTLIFTEQAQSDLSDIWEWNAREHGGKHADSYIALLLTETRRLTSAANPGKQVQTHPAYRYCTIKRRNRGYGHVVVFWVDGDKLHAFRYFHTARDWSTLIEGDQS